MGDSTTTAGAKILETAGKDSDLPKGERQLAANLATRVAVNANLPANTAFLFGSAPGKVAFESPELKAGFFTYYLAKALTDTEGSQNSVLTIGDLYRRVDEGMRSASFESTKGERGMGTNMSSLDFGIRPFMQLSGSPDLGVISNNDSNGGKKVALVTGDSKYGGNVPSVAFAVP